MKKQEDFRQKADGECFLHEIRKLRFVKNKLETILSIRPEKMNKFLT